MKNYNIRYLIIILIIIGKINEVDSSLVSLEDLSINTDSNYYYPDDLITLNASWNIFCKESDTFEIKILFLEKIPESYNSINSMISDSLKIIPFTNLNDSSLYNFNKTHFNTIINASELFTKSFEKSKQIWVTLLLFEWVGGDIDEIFSLKTSKIITLYKFEPVFKENINSSFNIEVGDQLFLNDSLIATENHNVFYPSGIISCIVSNQNQMVTEKNLFVEDNGFIFLNLSDIDTFSVCSYNITLILANTDIFFSNNLTFNIDVVVKNLEIIIQNNTEILLSFEEEIFFDFNFLDLRGNEWYLDNFTGNFNGDLNFSRYEEIDEKFRLYFQSPRLVGDYQINFTINKENYLILPFFQVFTFYRNNLDMNLFLGNILIDQDISFLLEGQPFSTFDKIKYSELIFEIFNGTSWSCIDFSVIEEYSSVMKFTISWNSVVNIPGITEESYFISRINFTGNELINSSCSNQVKIDFPAEFNFISNSTSIVEGQKIHFIFLNLKLLQFKSLFWDFGDETGNSTELDPIYQFLSPGLFSITLTILDNADNSISIKKDNYITILEDIEPVADFYYIFEQNIANEEIQFLFNGSYGNQNTTFLWDFGDGTSTDESNPIKIYHTSGNYSITLLIVDIDGDTDLKEKIDYIGILPDFKPEIDFFSNVSNAIAGEKVQFYYNGSLGNGNLTYFWDFGNGNFSYLRDPIVKYENSGIYSITLQIQDVDGDEDFLKKDVYIVISLDLQPSANFFCDQLQTIAGEPVQFFFNGTTGNENLTYFWDFGNGNSSLLRNPIVNYGMPGNYSISLKIQDLDGDTDEVNNLHSIEVFQDLQPYASFYSDHLWTIAGEPVHLFFNGTTGNGNLTYFWDFGDGTISNKLDPIKIYNEPGNYSITLRIQDSDGDSCEINLENYIIILQDLQPYADFYSDHLWTIAGESLQFFFNGTTGNGNLTYFWDFGDGTISNKENPIITYYLPGNYSISLIVLDFDGDENTIHKKRYINILPDLQPYADIIYNNSSAIIGGKMQFFFNGTLGNGNLTYFWDFGDGTISNKENPIKVFNESGEYEINLDIMDIDGDKDTIRLLLIVKKDTSKVFVPITILTGISGLVSISIRIYLKKKVKIVPLNSIKF